MSSSSWIRIEATEAATLGGQHEGTEARETADRYVRQTVLFATVLFMIHLPALPVSAVLPTATGLVAAPMIFALLG